ncbi:MAG: hypothetical protein JWO06_14 [Bacteroidota bacterium]|nr:hypothetical protein [Bacteroidota bacterium]
MKKVLSTKTLDKETVAYAHKLNMDIQCLDFIEVSRVSFKNSPLLVQGFDSIVFTSANAVKFFFEFDKALTLAKRKNIFSLNAKTTEMLDKYGIKPTGMAKNADELADVIIKNKYVQAVLHVCGNLRLDLLGEKLETAQIKYLPLVVYKTVPLNIAGHNEIFDAVMFFSPSGAESFFSANDLAEGAVSCCIGETTATKVKERSTAKVVLPSQATPRSMIETLANVFSKK